VTTVAQVEGDETRPSLAPTEIPPPLGPVDSTESINARLRREAVNIEHMRGSH